MPCTLKGCRALASVAQYMAYADSTGEAAAALTMVAPPAEHVQPPGGEGQAHPPAARRRRAGGVREVAPGQGGHVEAVEVVQPACDQSKRRPSSAKCTQSLPPSEGAVGRCFVQRPKETPWASCCSDGTVGLVAQKRRRWPLNAVKAPLAS